MRIGWTVELPNEAIIVMTLCHGFNHFIDCVQGVGE